MRYLIALLTASALLAPDLVMAWPPPPFWPSSHIRVVAFSPDGQLLAIGLESTMRGADKGLYPLIRLWDLGRGKEVRFCLGHLHSVSDLAFTPDGKFLLSGSHKDKTFRLWNVNTAKEVRRFELPKKSDFVGRLSPDGKRLVVWANPGDNPNKGEICIWDVTTGAVGNRFTCPEISVRNLYISPKADLLFLEGPRPLGVPNNLVLMDLKTGKMVHSFKDSKDENWQLPGRFSPDGKTLLLHKTAQRREKEKWSFIYYRVLWDIEKRKEVRRFQMGKAGPTDEDRFDYWVEWESFSPDGTQLLWQSVARKLQLFDLTAGEEVWSVESPVIDAHVFLDGGRRALLAHIVRDPDASAHLDVRCEWWELKNLGRGREQVTTLSVTP